MEVILIQDVPNLGSKDEIVKVRDGYARNFLIPQQFAIMASESARKVLAETVKQRAHKEEKLRSEAREMAAKIKDIKITVGAKTSSTGKIFGSVNNIQIAEALSAKGFDVDRRKIILKEDHIKEIGTYKARIKLYKEVETEMEFEVISE